MNKILPSVTSPLRSDHAALSLHSVSFGSYNKGYTVQPSARASPKFFFHFVPEKLRISLTLVAINFWALEKETIINNN